MKILDLTLSTPAANLACDEALLDAAETGQSGEVLRFWESAEHFVVVGYANRTTTEVNESACREKEIPILRRCTGGGTVLQGPGCLNYAVVLRIADDGPTRSISAANQFIMERNRTAIAECSSGCLVSRAGFLVRGHTDLALGALKFSGNSQRRRRNFLLFHGTFLLNFDLALVEELLRMPSRQPDYRASREHSGFLTNLGLTAREVKHSLIREWGAGPEIASVPTAAIERLVLEKYSKPSWNHRG